MSFLVEILFWAILGNMRSTGNQQVHQRAKLIEKHLKNDGYPRKHFNECLIIPIKEVISDVTQQKY